MFENRERKISLFQYFSLAAFPFAIALPQLGASTHPTQVFLHSRTFLGFIWLYKLFPHNLHRNMLSKEYLKGLPIMLHRNMLSKECLKGWPICSKNPTCHHWSILLSILRVLTCFCLSPPISAQYPDLPGFIWLYKSHAICIKICFQRNA